MADLSKLKLNGTIYNFKDAVARAELAELSTPPLATPSSDGLMSANDKQILDNMNPNMTVTISDIYLPETHIINAKHENMLDLEIIEAPHISTQIRTNNLLDTNSYTPGYYIGSNGNVATNANDRLGDFIPVTPGDDIYYTGVVGPTNSSSINRRLHVYTANQTWIKQISFAGSLHVGSAWSTHGVVPSNGAYIRVSWGTEDTNVMLSIGAPTKYEPYYITPFSAITNTSFLVSADDTYADVDTYTISVPAAAGNLYGFKYNPILGKLWATTGHIASYNGETLPSTGWLSDRDTYQEGTTPSLGAEVIYQLEENDIVEYDITPQTVLMFYRINYIKTDTGVIVKFSYYAETFAVSHLTINNGATFGETEFFEEDVQGWQHAAELIDTKANITSPSLLGAPQSTTPTIAANSDRIATTAFVQNLFGTNVAPLQTGTKAIKNYTAGEYFMYNGILYKTNTAIAQNATIAIGTDAIQTDIATELNLLRSLIS